MEKEVVFADFDDFEYKGGAAFYAELTSDNIITFSKLPIGKSWEDKPIKVVDDPGTAFHIQKTQIRADGGAAGLLRFLQKSKSWEDLFGTFASTIYNAVFDNMKAAKI